MDPLTDLHGIAVHFPIALLFVSVALDLLAFFPKLQSWLRPAALVTLVLGAAGTVVSVLTGPEDNARGVTMLMHTHETWAKVSMLLFGGVALWRLWLLRKGWHLSISTGILYVVIALAGLGALGYTGYLGGKMVYEEAIGVKRNGQMIVEPRQRGDFPRGGTPRR